MGMVMRGSRIAPERMRQVRQDAVVGVLPCEIGEHQSGKLTPRLARRGVDEIRVKLELGRVPRHRPSRLIGEDRRTHDRERHDGGCSRSSGQETEEAATVHRLAPVDGDTLSDSAGSSVVSTSARASGHTESPASAACFR